MNSSQSKRWRCIYSLDQRRNRLAGSEEDLVAAIARGADLRISTEFRHNEHIDTTSKNPELVQEVADFRVTYVLENCWVAGIISLRQPISLPDSFGTPPSMSLFLYNQNGLQAVARPRLDGVQPSPEQMTLSSSEHRTMPKYHLQETWDSETSAPSRNFVYDFDVYRFCVNDEWEEVLSHDADGRVVHGSVEKLAERFLQGCEIKIGIRGLCSDLAGQEHRVIQHEVFVHLGSCYYYTEQKLFIAGSHPVVRVQPAIPMRYQSRNWDFGWLMARTDGRLARRLVDPYTLTFTDDAKHHAIRWFVR